MSDYVCIVEVGLCDGLQNEKQLVFIVDKIELINCLLVIGLCSIEVISFVSLKWILQLVDVVEVYVGIQCCFGIYYLVLVLNEQGYDCV